MRRMPLIVALTVTLLSALPASATDIATVRGIVSVEAMPKTVAVYDVAAIDTLLRLGVRPAGVPEKLYVPELEAAKAGAVVIGTLFEPDLEALSALAPDLIIVGARSSAKMGAVAAVGQTLDMTIDGEDLFTKAKERLAAYGALFGRQAQAETIARDLDVRLAAARAAVAGKGKALIVMTNGPKVSAYGPGSRFGWVHAALDLPPAMARIDAATHGEAVSFEFIREANPDWLLVLDRAAAVGSNEQAARVTLDNELIAATTAWKKGQVVYLPAPDFHISAGGVQSLERVLATITEAFAAVH